MIDYLLILFSNLPSPSPLLPRLAHGFQSKPNREPRAYSETSNPFRPKGQEGLSTFAEQTSKGCSRRRKDWVNNPHRISLQRSGAREANTNRITFQCSFVKCYAEKKEKRRYYNLIGLDLSVRSVYYFSLPIGDWRFIFYWCDQYTHVMRTK